MQVQIMYKYSVSVLVVKSLFVKPYDCYKQWGNTVQGVNVKHRQEGWYQCDEREKDQTVQKKVAFPDKLVD